MKFELTEEQRMLVIDALLYYRDTATHHDDGICGLRGKDRAVLTRAINKIA